MPCPDIYRGPQRDPATAGLEYAKYIDPIVENLKEKGRAPSAFIAESLQSCGGQIIPPEGYLKEVYKRVRAAGGVCIADEVQVTKSFTKLLAMILSP